MESFLVALASVRAFPWVAASLVIPSYLVSSIKAYRPSWVTTTFLPSASGPFVVTSSVAATSAFPPSFAVVDHPYTAIACPLVVAWVEEQ